MTVKTFTALSIASSAALLLLLMAAQPTNPVGEWMLPILRGANVLAIGLLLAFAIRTKPE